MMNKKFQLPKKQGLLLLGIFFLFAACTPQSASPVMAGPAATPTPSFESSPLPPTAVPEPTATLMPSPTPAAPALCSPLEGLTFQDLQNPILDTNPFVMPTPGNDDGHHGTDFAYYRWGDSVGMLGLPIYSILNGKVAAVILDRPPYGNMVIIETRINDLPVEVQQQLALPAVQPTVQPNPALYCPEGTVLPDWDISSRSLYVLYAHMKDEPQLKIGEAVQCGQKIGEVGTTGMSVNEHLHLELRIGPSNSQFTEMAHYNTSCSIPEMQNYCLWRVSGWFQLIDPMNLINIGADSTP